MNCNLSNQAGPGIKEEVTSPSWENREKFAASREKCFLMEDTPQKHDYIISSYEPLADLFFLYFNIGPNNNKTKINNPKKKCCKNFFCKPLTCLILILFLFLKGAKSEEYLKKKKKIQKELCIHKDLIMATFPCKSNKRRRKKKSISCPYDQNFSYLQKIYLL